MFQSKIVTEKLMEIIGDFIFDIKYVFLGENRLFEKEWSDPVFFYSRFRFESALVTSSVAIFLEPSVQNVPFKSYFRVLPSFYALLYPVQTILPKIVFGNNP